MYNGPNKTEDRLDAYQDVQSPAVGILDAKNISTAQYQMHTRVPGTAKQTSKTSFFAPPCKSTNTCTFTAGKFQHK